MGRSSKLFLSLSLLAAVPSFAVASAKQGKGASTLRPTKKVSPTNSKAKAAVAPKGLPVAKTEPTYRQQWREARIRTADWGPDTRSPKMRMEGRLYSLLSETTGPNLEGKLGEIFRGIATSYDPAIQGHRFQITKGRVFLKRLAASELGHIEILEALDDTPNEILQAVSTELVREEQMMGEAEAIAARLGSKGYLEVIVGHLYGREASTAANLDKLQVELVASQSVIAIRDGQLTLVPGQAPKVIIRTKGVFAQFSPHGSHISYENIKDALRFNSSDYIFRSDALRGLRSQKFVTTEPFSIDVQTDYQKDETTVTFLKNERGQVVEGQPLYLWHI